MKMPIVRFQENEIVDCYEPYIQFTFGVDGMECVRSEFDGSKFIDGYVSKEDAIKEIEKLTNALKGDPQ